MKSRISQIAAGLRNEYGNIGRRLADVCGCAAGLFLVLVLVGSFEARVARAADLQTGTIAPVPGAVPQPKASLPPDEKGGGGTKAAVIYSGGLMDMLDNKQKLGVGDTLMFQVLEDQEEAKSISVTDTGELQIPELGLVKAAGKTCRQLGYEIKAKLEQTTYYHATVLLGIQVLNKTISGRRVYLAGQVRNTGPQEIPAGETWTVSRAIMGAGGFTDYADKKQVRVVRAGTKGGAGRTFIVNVADVLEKGQTDKDLAVEPEDLIYVPGRAINF